MLFHFHPIFLFLLSSSLLFSPLYAIRSFPEITRMDDDDDFVSFNEAPQYRNGAECAVSTNTSLVHVAMTLDFEYLRGSIAAVHSVLKHTSCPENIHFHFISSGSNSPDLNRIVRSAFPSLNFKIYNFDENLVKDLISSSVRQALEKPLNYARIYLAEMLESSINRVIYLDSDIIVVDDIQKLWAISLTGSRAIGAPEYCHTNFSNYFTDEFWFNPKFSRVFEGKRPCYFNTGVMVMDLVKWREGNYRVKIERWMEIQKDKRIYELGSLPPFLLVFGGDVERIDHRWNQHGLGGDNVENSCRSLHPGPVSLLHWSGKGKPWARIDAGMPCPVDYLWTPYDLHKPYDSHSSQR